MNSLGFSSVSLNQSQQRKAVVPSFSQTVPLTNAQQVTGNLPTAASLKAQMLPGLKFGREVERDTVVEIPADVAITAPVVSQVLRGLLLRHFEKVAKDPTDQSSLKLFLGENLPGGFPLMQQSALADGMLAIPRPVDVLVESFLSPDSFKMFLSATGNRFLYRHSFMQPGNEVYRKLITEKTTESAEIEILLSEGLRDLESLLMRKAGITDRQKAYDILTTGNVTYNALEALYMGEKGVATGVLFSMSDPEIFNTEELEKLYIDNKITLPDIRQSKLGKKSNDHQRHLELLAEAKRDFDERVVTRSDLDKFFVAHSDRFKTDADRRKFVGNMNSFVEVAREFSTQVSKLPGAPSIPVHKVDETGSIEEQLFENFENNQRINSGLEHSKQIWEKHKEELPDSLEQMLLGILNTRGKMRQQELMILRLAHMSQADRGKAIAKETTVEDMNLPDIALDDSIGVGVESGLAAASVEDLEKPDPIPLPAAVSQQLNFSLVNSSGIDDALEELLLQKDELPLEFVQAQILSALDAHIRLDEALKQVLKDAKPEFAQIIEGYSAKTGMPDFMLTKPERVLTRNLLLREKMHKDLKEQLEKWIEAKDSLRFFYETASGGTMVLEKTAPHGTVTQMPLVAEIQVKNLPKQASASTILGDDVLFMDTMFNPYTADLGRSATHKADQVKQEQKARGQSPSGIKVLVNSPGGSVFSLQKMKATNDNTVSPVHFIALGQAASCGSSYISSVKSNGSRLAFPSATIMLHEAAGSGGSRELRKLSGQLFEIYAKAVGKTTEEVTQDILSGGNLHFNPMESLFYGTNGLIDAIIVGPDEVITREDVNAYLVKKYGSQEAVDQLRDEWFNKKFTNAKMRDPEEFIPPDNYAEHLEDHPFANPTKFIWEVAAESKKKIADVPKLKGVMPDAKQDQLTFYNMSLIQAASRSHVPNSRSTLLRALKDVPEAVAERPDPTDSTQPTGRERLIGDLEDAVAMLPTLAGRNYRNLS